MFHDTETGGDWNLFLVKSSLKKQPFKYKFLIPASPVVGVDDFVDWAYDLFVATADGDETFTNYVLDTFETSCTVQELSKSINPKLLTGRNATGANRFDVQGFLQAVSDINNNIAELHAVSERKHAASDYKHAASDQKHAV